MESLMHETPLQTIERVKVRLAGLLGETRRALKGERDFNVEDVRRLREPVGEMASIVAQASEFGPQPEIAEQLQLYKSQLGELQTALLQIRVMLLSRQASLQASQSHTTAVSQWISAFGRTQ
jgi:hypothetical protein